MDLLMMFYWDSCEGYCYLGPASANAIDNGEISRGSMFAEMIRFFFFAN